MAINPNLVSIIPASELPTGVPTTAGQFFFYEGNEMKKSPMSEIYGLVSDSQSLGTITPSSTIPTEGNVWGFAGEGTYPNAGNITVASGKFAILSRVGTTWSKVEVEMPANTAEKVFNPLDDVNPSTMKATDIYLNSQLTTTITSRNLFDKSKIINDKYINTSNGTLSDSVGFWTSDFIEVDSSTNYVSSPSFTFIAFYDADKVYISGIGTAGQTAILTPVNTKYLRFSDNNNYELFQIEKGTVSTPYEEFYSYEAAKYVTNPVIIEKHIVTDGVNYGLIRAMIDSITDASEEKRYRIIVPKGEWHECDLQGKKYVEIIGEDIFDTVIYNDGLSTRLTPSDYSTPSESNKPLNQVPQPNKHIFYVTNDIVVKNLTIDARGNIKYCAHIDNNGFDNAVFKCIFKRSAEEVNNCVGIGVHSGQVIDLSDSVFIRNDNQPGIFVHNSTAQEKGTELIVDNCFFQGCSYILVDELGSGQNDWIYMRNCDANIDTNKFITVICEVNPVGLPYNFRMNIVGTKVNSIYQIPYNGDNNPRPNFAGYVIGNIG